VARGDRQVVRDAPETRSRQRVERELRRIDDAIAAQQGGRELGRVKRCADGRARRNRDTQARDLECRRRRVCLLALRWRALRVEQEVGTQGHLHLVLASEFNGARRAFGNRLLLRALFRGGMGVGILVGRLAVLDGFHPTRKRTLDGGGGVGVDAHIGAPVGRRRHP